MEEVIAESSISNGESSGKSTFERKKCKRILRGRPNTTDEPNGDAGKGIDAHWELRKKGNESSAAVREGPVGAEKMERGLLKQPWESPRGENCSDPMAKRGRTRKPSLQNSPMIRINTLHLLKGQRKEKTVKLERQKGDLRPISKVKSSKNPD